MSRLLILMMLMQAIIIVATGQPSNNSTKNEYWNSNIPLVSYRLPPPPPDYKPKLVDLDNDGDPDLIYSVTVNNTPILWIDDDDDLTDDAIEGDTDSDCLLIDVNRDGKYCDQGDVAVDWVDTDNDGIADLQVFVENAEADNLKKWGPGHYMWVIDSDKDNVFNYIDWDTFHLRAWLHEGTSNFLEDYNGKSTFLKAHTSTYHMNDVRCNWENPFLFFDPDNDGNSEMALRALDRPVDIEKQFTEGKISYVAMTYDLDNDNNPGNELDFDMSIRFTGKGFDYLDQVHPFNNPRVEATDTFFLDPRWRQTTELIYPDHDSAVSLTYQKGDWESIWFVYDEDDDCERWERVEFYEPLNPFKTGLRNGGLDNNPQADAIGDRGEWDQDNSGNANLYRSKFDGRLHLYGAEWGCWRVDQLAFSYQSWGGLYDTYQTKWTRAQNEFEPFSTFRYEDTDKNGFIDQIEMDLNGDTIFEKTVLLKDLGIDDRCEIIHSAGMDYEDYRKLHTSMSEEIWQNAQLAVRVAEKKGLNTSWYAFMKSPKSESQKYNYGYWLQFYIYMDLIDQARRADKEEELEKIDQAYFGGNWELLAD
ncbi:hypothetical protein [Mangrovibacterium sp.]|uniref:hypothetical protein n=1 Tax=Mangrovibacterium sp. TaxID=1961364 RepID=UPI003561D734